MNPAISRRTVLAGALAIGGAAIVAQQPSDDEDAERFGSGDIRSFQREPLQMAMLDRHAGRLATLIPDLEVLIGRRVAIEALSFDELYANFTFDLLQQTGRYDVVSMSDSWIPYFGRSGYFSEVGFPDEQGGPRSYPVSVHDAAVGLDPQLIEENRIVAYPWTFDTVCSAFRDGSVSSEMTADWISYARALADNPAIRVAVPIREGMTAAQAFRATSLSFSQELIDLESREAALNRYGSDRAITMLQMLTNRAGLEDSLSQTWSNVRELATEGLADHLPLMLASDALELLQAGGWRVQAVPTGRVERYRSAGEIWMLGVPAGAPSLDEARAAVMWLTSTDVQRRLLNSSSLLPVSRPAINSGPEFIDVRMQRLMLQALDTMQPVPRLRSFQSVMSIAGGMVPAVLRDPDRQLEIMNDANQRADDVLSLEGEIAD